MKKTLIALLFVAAGALLFAGGNSEKLTDLEGVALYETGADGATVLMLQQRDGTRVQLALSEADLTRLQLKDQDRLQVRGVYIGSTEADGTPARLLARTMTRDKIQLKLEDPVQLTEQDRLRIRAYETEQKNLRTRNQSRTPANTEAEPGTGSESGAGMGPEAAPRKNQ